MKKLFALLMTAALLLGLTACFGSNGDKPTTVQEPTPAQTTIVEAGTTIAAAPVSPDELSQRLIEEIFRPAIEMHGILCLGGVSYDFEDRFESYQGDNRWIYTRVTDSRFSSKAALEAAAREFFSEELTQNYLSLTLEDMISEGNESYDETQREALRQLSLFTEKDGKLYALVQSRGGNLSLKSIRIESESESKIIYTLRAVSPWEDEPVIDEEYFYARELINGKWVFTVFPTDWV